MLHSFSAPSSSTTLMDTRTIYLLSYRAAPRQRAHFAIFVPSAAVPTMGARIHVVGAPVTGFRLEFVRNYCPDETQRAVKIFAIGQVYSFNIVDSVGTAQTTDSIPRGNIEVAASHIPAPGISENFMAPVNDTTNRRCQEWTMEFIRYLVAQGLIAAEAIQIVQSQRDPPNHGIGLQPFHHWQGFE
ncbi:hypothetical protein N7535_002675 [Penicillium sp. DV-2018c]|nr:hypothetical protein N7461_001640 [Penicillium sp. DV-2018c]KAJ5575749.1 hypothetical protein N7535_002675 [Penicillium sp. DV-2018c]